MGLPSARSSSRDFRPSDKHRCGQTKSSSGRALPAGRGARPERAPRRPAGPRAPGWAAELRWGPGALLGAAPGGARRPGGPRLRQVPVRKARGVPRSAPASPGRASGGLGAARGPPAASSNFRWSRPPPGRPHTGLGPRSDRPPPQTAARARSPPRTPSAAGRGARGPAGLRAAEASQAEGPGQGFPRPPGPGRRVPPPQPPHVWSRRGGAGAQPMQGGAEPAGARSRCRPRPASVEDAPGRLPLPRPTRRRHLVYLPPPPCAAAPPHGRRGGPPLPPLTYPPVGWASRPRLAARPTGAADWAVWTQAGAQAGIGSLSAPPRGWIRLGSLARGGARHEVGGLAGSGRGETNPQSRPLRGSGLASEVWSDNGHLGTAVRHVEPSRGPSPTDLSEAGARVTQ